jgi:hypothetical protein
MHRSRIVGLCPSWGHLRPFEHAPATSAVHLKAIDAKEGSCRRCSLRREQREITNGESSRAPVRVGRRQIDGWFAPEVARQLHMIAVEEDTTLQAIMA